MSVPYRGIETITYVLRGDAEHGDSMGDEGVIISGDVQKRGHTVFAYVIDDKGSFWKEKNPFAYEVKGVNYFDIQRDP
jgi:redox-sensitive bicupin YhaK (pirin superfamily)